MRPVKQEDTNAILQQFNGARIGLQPIKDDDQANAYLKMIVQSTAGWFLREMSDRDHADYAKNARALADQVNKEVKEQFLDDNKEVKGFTKSDKKKRKKACCLFFCCKK